MGTRPGEFPKIFRSRVLKEFSRERARKYPLRKDPVELSGGLGARAAGDPQLNMTQQEIDAEKYSHKKKGRGGKARRGGHGAAGARGKPAKRAW